MSEGEEISVNNPSHISPQQSDSDPKEDEGRRAATESVRPAPPGLSHRDEEPVGFVGYTTRCEDQAVDYGTSLLHDAIYYQKEIQVPAQLVECLTQGFVQTFLPSLEKNGKTISQIKTSQRVLIETAQQENAKFSECQALDGLCDMMSKGKLYHAKLLKLRRDMTILHDKSAKLKRRALRLQQQKQKEELNKAQELEAEYEKEKLLVARVADSSQ